jgi:hypothetical protein
MNSDLLPKLVGIWGPVVVMCIFLYVLMRQNRKGKK